MPQKFRKERAKALLRYIQDRLQQFFPKTYTYLQGTTRLMKLVYLVDWLYARYSEEPSFTHARWKYHYYGPYAKEIQELMEVEEKELEDGRVFKKVKTVEGNVEFLDDLVKKIADYVVKEFGDYPLDELLELVYSTPPMRKAEQGDEIHLR